MNISSLFLLEKCLCYIVLVPFWNTNSSPRRQCSIRRCGLQQLMCLIRRRWSGRYRHVDWQGRGKMTCVPHFAIREAKGCRASLFNDLQWLCKLVSTFLYQSRLFNAHKATNLKCRDLCTAAFVSILL